MIRILEDKDAQSLIERKAVRLEEAERIVAPILADVRARGDASLVRHGADQGQVTAVFELPLVRFWSASVPTAVLEKPVVRA